MKITGTFLDEISHDIPHQNWGREEWEQDFARMRLIGIDTVILIRCGYGRWMTYPSKVLAEREHGYLPPLDLVDLFLDLAEKNGMKLLLGTYDSGRYWHHGDAQKESDINKAVIEEVWQRYGKRKAFGGWYLSQEVGRKQLNVIDIYSEIGMFCKEISNHLPIMISPFIDGVKALRVTDRDIRRDYCISIDDHQKEWNEILDGIKGFVNIVAFQDGFCDYGELVEFMTVNKELATYYGLESWTNCESFDRDMPIKFLPIKWEKMLLKLKAAQQAGMEKAITFEFSHFMSPASAYLQAGNLFKRYCEYFKIEAV